MVFTQKQNRTNLRQIIHSFITAGLICFVTTFITSADAFAEGNTSRLIKETSVSIAAVGDIIPHGAVKKTARQNNKVDASKNSINSRGYDEFFKRVKSRLSAPDYTFANMESPIAPKNHILAKSMVFNAPIDILYGLKNAGVDILSFANNHVYDQGGKGFWESRANMEKTGFEVIGVGDNCKQAQTPKIITHNGVKVAWIAATQLHNSRYRPKKGCTFYDKTGKTLVKSAQMAKEMGADFIIASIHWGAEYKTAPSKRIKRIANAAVEGGVDLIIGHHPHVLQPIVKRKTKDGRTAHIAYSLGNFLSNQAYHYRLGSKPISKGNTRDGGLIEFNISKKSYADGTTSTTLENMSLEPIWVVFKSWKKNVLRMQPRILRQEIAEQKEALSAAKSKKQKIRIAKRIAHLEQRFQHVRKIVGKTWVQPLAPAAD